MQMLRSAQPRPELRPFVRAYAQRVCGSGITFLVESVPAELEQIVNFELGVMPRIRHWKREIAEYVWAGGAQTSFSGHLELCPGVETFAVFFQPAGWSLLFHVPISEMTNQAGDATAFSGSGLRLLWNRLGEVKTFETRVNIVEEFLLTRVALSASLDGMAAAAHYLFRQHGALRISTLADLHGLGLRQFERRFEREIGMPPKHFARIARFQAALDAKLASPRRTWLDVAHSFGYYDQMHMIHDFEGLGHTTPNELILQMGDVRPPALVAEEDKTWKALD